MNLAEIREKHRVRILEEKMIDCSEERHTISEALSDPGTDVDQKLKNEYRIDELGLQMLELWCEYVKLSKPTNYVVTDDSLF